MALSNILQPNDYNLFCKTITGTVIPTPPSPLVVGPPVNATDNNVLQISGDILNVEYATSSRPGVVSATTQSFLGDKTIVGNLAATNLSGTNTGNVTLAAVGGVANANGASLTGQILNLQPANATLPGVLTAGTQSIGGTKNFIDDITADNIQGVTSLTGPTLILPITTSISSGTIQQAVGVPLLHTAGTNNAFYGSNSGNFTLTGDRVIGIGRNTGFALTTGNQLVCVGDSAGGSLTTGGFGVLVGTSAGGALTTGINNVMVGPYSGAGVTTGGGNIFIGQSSGFSSAATCANAISITNDSIGTCITGDIRIGLSASLACYIAALSPVLSTPSSMLVYNSSTRQVGSANYSKVTTNYTVTLDAGTITSSTVRGVSTAILPITLTRTGDTVTMVIPAFTLVTQSAAASTINLTGVGLLAATYRPTYNMSFIAATTNNAAITMGVIYVTAGGAVSWQVGPPFIVPTGSVYDLAFSWNIAP